MTNCSCLMQSHVFTKDIANYRNYMTLLIMGTTFINKFAVVNDDIQLLLTSLNFIMKNKINNSLGQANFNFVARAWIVGPGRSSLGNSSNSSIASLAASEASACVCQKKELLELFSRLAF